MFVEIRRKKQDKFREQVRRQQLNQLLSPQRERFTGTCCENELQALETGAKDNKNLLTDLECFLSQHQDTLNTIQRSQFQQRVLSLLDLAITGAKLYQTTTQHHPLIGITRLVINMHQELGIEMPERLTSELFNYLLFSYCRMPSNLKIVRTIELALLSTPQRASLFTQMQHFTLVEPFVVILMNNANSARQEVGEAAMHLIVAIVEQAKPVAEQLIGMGLVAMVDEMYEHHRNPRLCIEVLQAMAGESGMQQEICKSMVPFMMIKRIDSDNLQVYLNILKSLLPYIDLQRFGEPFLLHMKNIIHTQIHLRQFMHFMSHLNPIRVSLYTKQEFESSLASLFEEDLLLNNAQINEVIAFVDHYIQEL